MEKQKNSLLAASCTPSTSHALKEAIVLDSKLGELRKRGTYPTISTTIKMSLLYFFNSNISSEKLKSLYEISEDEKKFKDSLLSVTGKETA